MSSTIRWILTLFTIIGIALSLIGCSKTEPVKYVTLSNLEPVSSPEQGSKDTLRVALAVGLSPTQSIAKYQTLTTYLSEKLNRPVELIQKKTYKEVDDLIEEGNVDIAFVCSSSYVIGHEKFGERLIAVPITNGSPYYQSVIIANANTDIRNWSQLQGRSFAFVDPQSTSGALYAMSQVKERGGLNYFKSYIYTYGHSNSIAAVRDRLVDAAAVDNYTLTSALASSPQLTNTIRIIDNSPEYANNPVVASPRLDEQTYLAVQAALINMDQDSSGQDALKMAGYERFDLLEDNFYGSVRHLLELIKE
ncbi:substrate-binding domain-containing protein [Desulfosporosinus nitroreducens]|uniref:substrate-binding domain-containing protein n=1 Tax=Desulfosporosinus nitroreducens TaxID=2018668 RepID=UPI00207CB95F|nr:phosphate/phosphite/phosphonate ABC transporter substrate-binding protein [Desulfosporosinus nitroreducens]MCO1600209.1 phosphate/phosphite/phosphonate ABC transporter substrate-binding protein [Desulfosporosinus nitroreducens]